MALCTRCGRQTEGAAEFCSGCGSYRVSRESEQPQAVVAMTGAAGYLRPFTSHGRDGTELPPDPVSTPPSRYWSLQPASPTSQPPEPGRYGADDTGRYGAGDPGRYGAGEPAPPASGLSMPRGPFEPVRPAGPDQGAGHYQGASDYQAAPAYPLPDHRLAGQPDPPAGGYAPRSGPPPTPDQAVQAYDPRPQYARPAQPGQFGAPEPGGAQPPAQPSPASASGSGLPDPSGPPSPADLAGAGNSYPPGGYAPAGPDSGPAAGSYPPLSQAAADAPASGYAPADQAAAGGYPLPGPVTGQSPAGSYAPPGQFPAAGYPLPSQSPAGSYAPPAQYRTAGYSPTADYSTPGQSPAYLTPSQSSVGSYAPGQIPAASYPAPDQAVAGGYPAPDGGLQAPGHATAQFPAAATPTGMEPASSILTTPDAASAEAQAGQAPAGEPGTRQPAGAFAPSGPAWLTRGQPAGSDPAGPERSRAESATGRRGLRRRTPESGRAAFPAEDEANEQPPRGPRGGTHSGRWIPFAAAAVVLIVCAVSAAILLSQGKTPAKNRAAAGPTARPRQPSPTPAPTRSQLISTSPAAASGPHAPAVVAFLTRYFTAINDHDFPAYKRLFTPSLRGGLSRTAFVRGYGSSQDSQATLQSIAGTGQAELAAAVTFTSHQRPAASPKHTACNVWTISLYLAQHGSGYVIVSPPSSYQASVSTCP